MNVRNEKVYTVVEYLKMMGFDADVQDLEGGVDALLEDWHIQDVFSPYEKEVLLEKLYRLASENQNREIDHMINNQIAYLEVI
jgi:hypothetical protein